MTALDIKVNEDLFNRLRAFEQRYGFGGILSSLVQNDISVNIEDVIKHLREADSMILTKTKNLAKEYDRLFKDLCFYLLKDRLTESTDEAKKLWCELFDVMEWKPRPEPIDLPSNLISILKDAVCSDGNCIFKITQEQRRGMHTNGGCHCLDGLSIETKRALQSLSMHMKILCKK